MIVKKSPRTKNNSRFDERFREYVGSTKPSNIPVFITTCPLAFESKYIPTRSDKRMVMVY